MKKWTLPSKLHRYVYKKDIDKALGFLSKITAINESGLFQEYDEGYLRFAGAFRVQLLMEWGYYREALAWACLEVELYPDNIRAVIFKESLKKKIYNLPSEKPQTPENKDTGGVAGCSRDARNKSRH